MRILALVMATILAVVCLAACGGDGDEEGPPAATVTPAAAGTETPAATPTPAEGTEEVTPTSVAEEESAASDIAGRLDEIVLGQEDVPGGLNQMMSTSMDMDFDFLPEATADEGTAYMSMLADDAMEDMIMSMAFYLEDSDEVAKALDEIEDMSVDQLKDDFGLLSDLADVELVDTRKIDVSSLGDGGLGLGMTLEMEGMGTMDAEYAFFGDGPVMAMVATIAMGDGDAADVLPLAKTMADKIEAVLE
jgi:predicted small lipoprotein YifL